MKAKSRSLAYVGVAFVALSSAVALNVIWRIGGLMEGTLRGFGSSLPVTTRLAVASREAMIICIWGALMFAIAVHRHERAVPWLVIVGLVQLIIAAAFFLAEWLPLSGYFGTSPPMLSR